MVKLKQLKTYLGSPAEISKVEYAMVHIMILVVATRMFGCAH